MKREMIERVGLWRSLEKVRYIDLWLQYFENTNRAYQSKDFAFSRLRHRPTRALEHHVLSRVDEFQMKQQVFYNCILLSQQFLVSTIVCFTFTNDRCCRVIEHISSDSKSIYGSIILQKLRESLETHISRLTREIWKTLHHHYYKSVDVSV